MKCSVLAVAAVGCLFFSCGAFAMKTSSSGPAWLGASMKKLEKELTSRYGDDQRGRLRRGMKQVGMFWREEDGDEKAFEQFVRVNFAGDRETLDMLFDRYEKLLEKLDGYMNAIVLAFREQADLDLGPMLPVDELFAGYDPAAHITEDFFANRIAFVVLLNFPLTTLEERLEQGEKWTRRQWAEARLAERFGKRIPAEVNLAVARAAAHADKYVAGYNIWMHHLVDSEGRRLFPPGMRLLSHWNLRDEIKADYGDAENGFAKQRMIVKVMERIVDQTIPAVVVDNPCVDWNPFTNEVESSRVKDYEAGIECPDEVSGEREQDERYAIILETFRASRKVDPYSPTAPTLIARRFDEDREIPEARVRRMLEDVLESPVAVKVAGLIEKRLGRPLEPFDIWYDGFKPRGALSESRLDEMVRKRYPTAEAYWKDIPNLLMKLGFAKDKAVFIAQNIEVDPARGSGHAWGAEMRSQKAHLRTRIGSKGMDYKGFNIAVHEMGHNVEQVLSLNEIDHTLLRGVPNTAFTEAMAFVFQARDLELLGLENARDERSEALETIDQYWGAYEISGVALIDMGIWHWMYDHPDATPAELRQATIEIAKDVWNRFYARVFGVRDVYLLAIYSHILHSFLYIPDYPLGYFIAFQVQEQMRKTGKVGEEFERMVKAGDIAPDLWMEKATGSRVGPGALLEAAERALAVLERTRGH